MGNKNQFVILKWLHGEIFIYYWLIFIYKMVNELHNEVVTGIVQVIKYLADKRAKGAMPSFGEAMSVGFNGRTEDAQTYICEFVKDGVVNLRQEDIDAVVKGDYVNIWKSTNNYLKGFGYDPVEPEPISPNFTTE
jgi:hypothetical protein